MWSGRRHHALLIFILLRRRRSSFDAADAVTKCSVAGPQLRPGPLIWSSLLKLGKRLRVLSEEDSFRTYINNFVSF